MDAIGVVYHQFNISVLFSILYLCINRLYVLVTVSYSTNVASLNIGKTDDPPTTLEYHTCMKMYGHSVVLYMYPSFMKVEPGSDLVCH